jgi:hypothetical protein
MRRDFDPTMQAAPILPEGADINAALHRAAREDNGEMVMHCLDRGADATSYENGYTPIGAAALSGSSGAITKFREFYYESRNCGALVSLLEQPQGFTTFFGITIPFVGPEFANFNEIIIARPELYPEWGADRDFFLNLKDEADSRASTDLRDPALLHAAQALAREQRDGDPRRAPAAARRVVGVGARRAPLRADDPRAPEDDPAPVSGAAASPSPAAAGVAVEPVVASGRATGGGLE